MGTEELAGGGAQTAQQRTGIQFPAPTNSGSRGCRVLLWPPQEPALVHAHLLLNNNKP